MLNFARFGFYKGLDNEGNPNLWICYRHSKAMALLEKGVDLIHIRDFLRHKSVQTTEIYARANPRFVFDAIKKAYENLTNEEPKWKTSPGVLGFLRKLTR